ncbi:receptor-type tyrosine-protein phosphatase alpha isoform X10 [Symphalangus syndactylus]|uniref:receptor-type tyrosine-protein phosphatase alpha isoform X10 n=1 Tax=Symphalangus syndactylus TaxID=9590 RepID=UPI0024429AAB|nr:receptor-type tyrosine-protein phosphatase alpha isoform X9 [Symphalangus syndactylus]
MDDAVQITKMSMDSWFILVLLGSGLVRVSASNATTVAPSVGITRLINSSTAEPVKEEAKTSNPTSSLTSLSVAPTFSPNITLGPTYLTTVNSSDSDNGTTRTASTNSIGITISPNGTWLPDNQFTDARTEPWEGNSSTAATTPETFPPSDETPIIAVMVALSSLLVIVFIIIVLYMLRFKKYKQAGSHSNSFRLSNGRTEDVEPQSVPLLARSPSTNRKYPPLPVDKLEEEINRRMADDNKLFREEFNALPACPIQATCEAASKEENKEKNRYVNILPYDHSRVHLTPVEGVPDSDYINASFINGYQEKNKFIAAQGPKEETVNDFWRMIWEQNTATIVMVTNLKERKECKCAQYWPDQGCWTYGNIRVSVEDVTVLVDYTVRKFCIQQMQYVFIYQALLEHYLYGDTELEVTSLETHLQKIYNKIPGTSNNGLEEEFKKLTSIKIQNDKMRTGNLPANMKKNRVLQIIPYEFNRVIIPVKRGEENTDYVNASFIDGYRQKDSYIASQGPLLHTIEDFWRMIWEWKSCSIVMLTELEERGQEKCAQYWPSDGLVSYGDITVELKKEEECESYTVRDLLVTNTRENKSRQIRQFHFHGWPEVGIPSDGKGMISIIAAVQKQQQQSGNHPITVHCSAGAGRTGTFCALSTVLERVKAEGILDVFQTVKSLRLQRPHMVQTLEQYEFCYKVVQEYIDAFSDYANFK